jgi:superfamily I DNA/RNA helicase
MGAMREALARLDLSSENFTPGAVLGAISRAKNEMCTPAEFRAQRQGWQDRKIADIFDTYQKVLTEQNAVDFDDLLVKAAMLLGEHPELRERLEDRYRYVLVDEYQDTNRAQYLIARGLCLERGNLCVTGDPDQSIYAWRGADIGNILAFEEDFPAARVVRLEENYRSTPDLIRNTEHNAAQGQGVVDDEGGRPGGAGGGMRGREGGGRVYRGPDRSARRAGWQLPRRGGLLPGERLDAEPGGRVARCPGAVPDRPRGGVLPA